MNPIRKYIQQCRLFFIYAGLFSFFINLLMLASPLYMMQLFDRVLSSRSNETLVMLTVLVIFLLIIQHYLEHLRTTLFLRTSLALQKSMQKTVLDCMLGMTQRGSANRRGMDDVHTVQSFFSGAGVQAVFEVPWVPIYLFVLYLFHPWLVVLAVLGIIVLSALMVLEEKVTAENQTKGTQSLRDSQEILDSALDNREVLNALSMRTGLIERWSLIHEDALSKNTQSATKAATVVSWSRFVKNLITTLALAIAAYLVINDRNVSAGVMIAATIVIGRVMVPIDRVISGWKFFIRARDAYGRLNAMLESYDPESEHVTLNEVEGAVSAERVIYSVAADRHVLKGVHFSLPAGESLGIIGNSAAGKSTLSRLLVGLFKPTSGAVRIDGADVHHWSRTGKLGPYIGYLPQSIELFAGTVGENIARLGDPIANADEIIEAAKLAGAHDFILRLPQAYDTEIGRSGELLSAGQRQLIGLARALFGTPRVVVLDEPNANLDGPSEQAFLRLIRELKNRGVTLIIVSHKPSVLRDVDKLLVLEQGRQLHFGNREDVLRVLKPGEPIAQPVALVKGD